jgi:glucose/arabinose dehydrogenase
MLISINNNLFCETLILDKIVSGLYKPVFLTYHDDMLFIIEQNGRVRAMINGELSSEPVLDITDRVHYPKMPADERGLLGIALHPDIIKNNFFYLNYIDKSGNSVVSQFKINLNSMISDPNSEKIILSFKQPYQNHNGGHMLFGPDRKLYISVGDGGYAGDPHSHGQNYRTLFGSILRLDVDQDNGYTIPLDNPFLNQNNARPEIWCYGLRNPWRFSFDRQNSDLYIGDVGQGNWEEINYLPFNEVSGKNFGWNQMEGKHNYNDAIISESDYFIDPVFEYPNNANYIKALIGWDQNNAKGCSVTGGYVYRGQVIEEVFGLYFFGDYCTGKVWTIKIDSGNSSNYIEWDFSNIKEDVNISSFAEDKSGELYILNHSGSIYKIINIEK